MRRIYVAPVHYMTGLKFGLARDYLTRHLTRARVIGAARCGHIANHLLPRVKAAATDYKRVAEILGVRPGWRAYRFLTGMALGLVIGLAFLMAAALLPGAFGYTPLVVVSGSMEPTLRAGDIAVTREVEPYSLQLGDVVTYNTISGFITHRIVGIDMSPRGPFFLMKGDANLSADPRAIPSDRIVAKVVYRIPKLGFLVSFTDSMLGRLFLIAAPLLGLGLMAMRRRDSLARERSRVAGVIPDVYEEEPGSFPKRWQGDTDARSTEVELIVGPSLGTDKLLRLHRRLLNAAGAEVVKSVGSKSEGTSIRIAFQQAVPLMEILEALPEVSEVRDTSTNGGASGESVRRLKRA